jgi:hypothetical protein
MHYHATIARSDGAAPNQQVTLEADSIEQARKTFADRYGQEAVLNVWDDYFEAHAPVK